VGPSQSEFWAKQFKFGFKTTLRLIHCKSGLPKLKIFEGKYGSTRFELRNNFSYWNFFKFRIEIKLKILGTFLVLNLMGF
jgi:hypothetical protein